MYKCLECGHIFDEGEQSRWVEDYGERMTGCPLCLGDYAETYLCSSCGGEFLDDEMYCGICPECLKSAVTYDNFIAYLEASKKRLLHFMFDKWFGCAVPESSSAKLETWLSETARRLKANDLLTDTTSFLDACIDYVMEDDGECGRYDFAEWLKERGKK
jgi:hypothetical protein